MWLRLPPINLVSEFWQTAQNDRAGFELPAGDQELTRFAFTGEIIDESALIFEPVTELVEIRERLDDFFINVDDFWALGDGIEILGHDVMEPVSGPPILRVDFEVNGEIKKAYAYGQLKAQDSAPRGAALVVPGSGANQAWSIANSEADNYHCCIWDALEGFARFAVIKPNESGRAIHNGSFKLSEDFFVVDHLHRGGSYSASYIAESAAIATFLKSQFSELSLLGLSQGGHAALATAMLVEPDWLVVASGYSVISEEQLRWAGLRQIIIPGMAERFSFDNLSRELTIPTLFSWGTQEEGTHGIESRDGVTCERIEQVDNFHCEIFDGGHSFPEAAVIEFLIGATGE